MDAELEEPSKDAVRKRGGGSKGLRKIVRDVGVRSYEWLIRAVNGVDGRAGRVRWRREGEH